MREVPEKATEHTVFQKAVLRLHNAMTLFMRWQNILQPMDGLNASSELASYEAGIAGCVAAFKARMAEQSFDTNALTSTLRSAERFMAMPSTSR